MPTFEDYASATPTMLCAPSGQAAGMVQSKRKSMHQKHGSELLVVHTRLCRRTLTIHFCIGLRKVGETVKAVKLIHRSTCGLGQEGQRTGELVMPRYYVHMQVEETFSSYRILALDNNDRPTNTR